MLTWTIDSDQQIMTGIAIQSVGLAKIHTMVSYHFFIIWVSCVFTRINWDCAMRVYGLFASLASGADQDR